MNWFAAVPPSPISPQEDKKETGDTRVDQKASSTDSRTASTAWRDVTDDDKHGNTVLVYDPTFVPRKVMARWDRDAEFEGGQCWRTDDISAERVDPTHVMDLDDIPNPPSDEAGRGVPPASPICAARKGLSDPPQDCDWPLCGCDPHAEKVIEALKEAGKLAQAVPPASGWQPIEIVKRAIVEWREMERIETGEAESNREREPRPANLSYHTACARRRVFKLCADRLQAALDAAPLPSSDPPPQRSKS